MRAQATILRALKEAANRYGVDLLLLTAICQQESGLNPLAVGDVNAGVSLGLGQQNLRGAGAGWTAKPHELLDPRVNALATAGYLGECLAAFPGEMERAISAYNQGIVGAARDLWWQVNGEEYIQPVLGHLERFKREGLEETWDADVPEGLREYGKTLLDVAINLKGICDDVLASGRRLQADLLMIEDQAKRSAKRWGSR